MCPLCSGSREPIDDKASTCLCLLWVCYLSQCVILLWTGRDWFIYASAACVHSLYMACDHLHVHKYVYKLHIFFACIYGLIWRWFTFHECLLALTQIKGLSWRLLAPNCLFWTALSQYWGRQCTTVTPEE